MTDKATFELEVEALRKAMDAARTRARDGAGAAAASAGEAVSGLGDTAKAQMDRALEQLEGSDIERLAKEFTAELEELHAEKPVMTLFGAFLLGYLLGRAR